jgi:hypothetical protein
MSLITTLCFFVSVYFGLKDDGLWGAGLYGLLGGGAGLVVGFIASMIIEEEIAEKINSASFFALGAAMLGFIGWLIFW